MIVLFADQFSFIIWFNYASWSSFHEAKSVDLLVKNGLTPQQQVVFECSREMHQKSQRAEGLLEKVASTSCTSEDACSICYEDQDGKEEVASLPCGHHFHKKCVKKWLVSGHFRCPLCNDDFETTLDGWFGFEILTSRRPRWMLLSLDELPYPFPFRKLLRRVLLIRLDWFDCYIQLRM